MENAQQLLNEALRHHQAGRLDAAKSTYSRLLTAAPDQPAVLAQLGQSLLSLGCRDEAEKAYRKATDLFPGDFDAQSNLGAFYAMHGRWDLAEGAYKSAVSLDPEHDYAGSRLALVTLNQKRPEAAIELLRASLERMPEDIGLRAALAKALCMAGRYEEHLALVRDLLEEARPTGPATTGFVRDLFSNPDIDVRTEGDLLPKLMRCLRRDVHPPVGSGPERRGGKLKIAYLSAFMKYRNYMGFVHEILARHDRTRFDVRVYSDCDDTNPLPSVYGTKSLTNEALNRRIRADGVDIVVDLNGFAFMDRLELLAMKPSPVVVSWFNAYSTLGLETVDYLIGDEFVAPPGEDRYYGEKILRLPDCYLVRDINETVPPVSQAPHLRNGYMTFGSLAAGPKLHPAAFQLWSAILREVPDSRLVLRNAGLDDYLGRYFLDQITRCGIDPSRVRVLGPAAHAAFLATYDEIDIGLDSFPWNGGTTTFEALWQGVPVVTYRGDRWVSRVGATIVNAAGFPQWAGRDLDDYAAIATGLARDPAALREIRAGLRQRLESSVLYDTVSFTRKLEAAYGQMAREKGLVG